MHCFCNYWTSRLSLNNVPSVFLVANASNPSSLLLCPDDGFPPTKKNISEAHARLSSHTTHTTAILLGFSSKANSGWIESPATFRFFLSESYDTFFIHRIIGQLNIDTNACRTSFTKPGHSSQTISLSTKIVSFIFSRFFICTYVLLSTSTRLVCI